LIPLDQLQNDFETALASARTSDDIKNVERTFVGKTSAIRQALKSLAELPPEERAGFAAQVNALRGRFDEGLTQRKTALAAEERLAKIAIEWLDRSMPGTGCQLGSLNPVTIVEDRSLEILRQLGFEIEEGPEIETEYYCFDALNIPKHHPARDMQDTFFLAGGRVLRTHTTSVQARVLSTGRPLPLRIISRGRVYRNEDVDATHLAMFHQLEGFWLDRDVSFAQMKWVLRFMAEGLFGPEVAIRFKPKFYPYTEPSLGMDIQCTRCAGDGCAACHDAGWLTVIGAGMIHPKVLRDFGYDPETVSGFAFGWGTTRLASQFFSLPEIRAMYQPDVRFFRTLLG
jgi:phenylalanyl-tRNA synthetase alpha chain